ncbi:MAG: hypothetical protein ABFD76_06755 [Smithella sp.]
MADKEVRTSKNQLKQKDKAIDIASEMFAKGGFCTHYPGYTCDKDWPKECPACIRRWLLQKAREELGNE